MAKHNRPQKTSKAPEPRAPDEPISALGWKIIAAGGLCVVAGFFTLSKVDPLGRNWAADVSPLLILGGYALIGGGLFVPASEEGGTLPPSTPPSTRP